MEERKTEKRIEVEEETTDVEHRRSRPGTTNVNVGPNGETQIQETTIEERKEP